MKNILSAFIVMLLCTPVINGQLRIPSMSPKVTSTYEIGLTEVTISYSQPSKRGRKIFGSEGIVPYSTPWRTGANAATKLIVSSDVVIEGKNLPKGEYALLSMIGEDDWSIMFYDYTSSNWNSYVDEIPKLELSKLHLHLKESEESLIIKISGVNMDHGKLSIQWDQLKVEMDIVVESHDKIMRDIDRVIKGTSNNEYYQAALYLHEKNIQLETALMYIQKVTSQDSARFFHLYREAAILFDLGRIEEMRKAAKIAMQSAIEAGNDDFVKLNEALLK